MKLSHALYLPYPGYLGTVARRSILMWLLLRLLLFVFLLVATRSSSVAIRVPTFGMPVLFVRLDRQLFRELLLPANLGASELWFWAVSLSVVLGLDLAAALLLGPG
jgi:hypothetical protein